jgi:serine/threonine-protein kinase
MENKKVVRLGKYTVIKHIATGGMGAVYRAHDAEANREVALKVLPLELAAKPAMVERFKREARSAAKLSHENIVSVYEFGEVGGTYYLAMEFVEGIDLHDHIKKSGTIDPEESRQIVLQAARALREANEQSIVHRDIKPSNFLLARKENRWLVKLTDFGLAREIESDEFRVTHAGTTVGTIDYMSPEQARDSGRADIRSDLYALGCTWYHALAGHVPFPEGGLGERLFKIMNEPPPDLRDINPKVSDECWEILSKLLSKDANDRYQTPSELINDLLTLQGKTTARKAPAVVKPAKKPKGQRSKSEPEAGAKPRSKSDANHDAKPRSKQKLKPKKSPPFVLYAVLVGVAILALGVGAFFVLSGPGKPRDDQASKTNPPITPVIGDKNGDTNTGSDNAKDKDKDKAKEDNPLPKTKDPVTPIPVDPRQPKTLAYLSPTVKKLNVASLRKEVEAPWHNVASVPADAPAIRVARAIPLAAETARSLAAACKSTAPGRVNVIEVHDNGPFYELPLGVLENREIVIRAGKGYRPLIVWDLPATKTLPGLKPNSPLTFVTARNCKITLQGCDLVFRWPEAATNSATLMELFDSDLDVRDCSFLETGKSRGETTLVNFRSESPDKRCRFVRSQVRGSELQFLRIHAPQSQLLIDGCLITVGEASVFGIEGAQQPANLRVVRSTVVSGLHLLDLKPAINDKSPAVSWFSWDSLLSRSSTKDAGDLLFLRDNADAQKIEWRAINSLYAGWNQLLTGPNPIRGHDHASWRKTWPQAESDATVKEIWPDQVFTEPATQPTSAYLPSGAVSMASSLSPTSPLGCDLANLPTMRGNWVTRAFDPVVSVPEFPDDSVPEIPNLADGKFHGGRLDLTDTDLGDYLAKTEKSIGFGPKIVLHLSGKGDRTTQPIRIKGSSLVLHFEEPLEKDTPRCALSLGRTSKAVPLIEVEGGNLSISNGVLKVPDQPGAKVSHVVKVSGGDLQLYQTRLEGPQRSVPEGYQSAIHFQGNNDPTAERLPTCVLSECVVVSSMADILLSSPGCRLGVRQSLLVSGSEAISLQPGRDCKIKPVMQCMLEHTTIAARRAGVRLGDVTTPEICEGIVVKSKECAWLNPFPGGSKAGLLLCEGQALSRGQFLWHSEKDGFDQRLHFAASSLTDSIPELKEGWSGRKTLWGSFGTRLARELPPPMQVFEANRWPLERLLLRTKDAPGANLDRLGVLPKKN